LHDADRRAAAGLNRDPNVPDHYIFELNLKFGGGLPEAEKQFRKLLHQVLGDGWEKDRELEGVSIAYYHCLISVTEWCKLLRLDQSSSDPKHRSIHRIWPDYTVKPLIDRSVATVKADAARRSFDAAGERIVWAVIDSGIDGTHPHFNNPEYLTLSHESVAGLHRDFTVPMEHETERFKTVASALLDPFGHGTHVAGIIAGGLPAGMSNGQTKGKTKQSMRASFRVFQRMLDYEEAGDRLAQRISERHLADSSRLRGVAPRCKLVSLRVLDGQGAGRARNVMKALRYVREINGEGKTPVIHGVNISIGYEFDAEIFACGQSPLCEEVERLVRSGVVVVVAAGNTGYGRLAADQRTTRTGMMQTINDPGNAEGAITVGATHRDSPHTFGVSYFSSKGPTGDGRLKPDLVAPGERITSCAAGTFRNEIRQFVKNLTAATAVYLDRNGTSMAAPHVSGAIAAFLSIRREFIKRREEVKKIFLGSAMSLGRERYFEGHGMVDLMKAIQSV
jgi:subtilisin family serine protease